MQKIAKFQKVSETQFIQDWLDTFPASTAEEAVQIYAGDPRFRRL